MLDKLPNLFSSIGRVLLVSMSGFDKKHKKSKNGIFQTPGIKIPVCLLNPFFVGAWMGYKPIKQRLIEIILLFVEPLTYVYTIYSIGLNFEKIRQLFESSNEYKKIQLQLNHDIVEDIVNNYVPKILWVCFFLLSISFISVPVIVGYAFQNTEPVLRIIIQIMVTSFIVGIIFSNLIFLQTFPIIMSIITIIVYTYVRYIRIMIVCVDNKSSKCKITKDDSRAMDTLFVLQSKLDNMFKYIGNLLVPPGSWNSDFFLIPIRIIGLLFSGSWFSNTEQNIKKPFPDSLYEFYYDIVFGETESVIPNNDSPKNDKLMDRMNNLENRINLLSNCFEEVPCYERKKMIFFSSFYYGSIILSRLVIIPILITNYIISKNLDDSTTDEVTKIIVLLLTLLLIIIVLSTLIIIFPNPKGNKAVMKPFIIISLYMTVIFLPSFIIAWRANNIVFGCFDNYDAFKKLNKAFAKLGS